MTYQTYEERRAEEKRKENRVKLLMWAGGGLVVLGIAAVIVWYLFFTTAGQDFRTNITSDVSGIEREVVVYTQFGDELERYSGQNIRMDYSSEGRVQIQLDSGKRVQVSNALVIVEEPEGGEE